MPAALFRSQKQPPDTQHVDPRAAQRQWGKNKGASQPRQQASQPALDLYLAAGGQGNDAAVSHVGVPDPIHWDGRDDAVLEGTHQPKLIPMRTLPTASPSSRLARRERKTS